MRFNIRVGRIGNPSYWRALTGGIQIPALVGDDEVENAGTQRLFRVAERLAAMELDDPGSPRRELVSFARLQFAHSAIDQKTHRTLVLTRVANGECGGRRCHDGGWECRLRCGQGFG